MFVFLMMPFNLSSAAQTFQQSVHKIARSLGNMYMHADDILVASHPKQRHWARLRSLFDRLSQHGITVNASKCNLGVPSLT